MVKYTLKELVEYKQKIDSQAEEQESSEEIKDLAVLAEALLQGKIDQAVRFKVGLESHIQAAKENLFGLNQMLEHTEQLMHEAVLSSETKRLEGLAYTLRSQNNSRASVVIEDEAQVPKSFYKGTFSTDFNNDEENLLFYAGVLLKRIVNVKPDLGTGFFDRLDITSQELEAIKDHISFNLNRKEIEASLKNNKEVPGARLERGQHLRVEVGKSKSQLLKQSVEGVEKI